MRFSSGLGVGLVGVSACLLLAPLATVSAKTRVELRPEFRAMLFVPQEQAPPKPKAADAELPDGTGKDVVVKHCTMCHAANTFSRQRHDKDKWNQIIDNMTSKGMEATDAEIDTIATYLSTNFGADAPATEPVAPKPATPNR